MIAERASHKYQTFYDYYTLSFLHIFGWRFIKCFDFFTLVFWVEITTIADDKLHLTILFNCANLLCLYMNIICGYG